MLKPANIVIRNLTILLTIDISSYMKFVDKEKLFYILENNNFNEEINDIARNYYDSV